MATTRKPDDAEIVYDFDAFDEEAEEKALAAAVPDVKHIIVERRFIGRFPDGTVIEMPLSLSLDMVDQISEDTITPVDQFKMLITEIAGTEALKEFTAHDLVEASIMAEKYFRTLQKIQQAAFPKS